MDSSELQEGQDQVETLQVLLKELTEICADREQVLTPMSLQVLATSERAEPPVLVRDQEDTKTSARQKILTSTMGAGALDTSRPTAAAVSSAEATRRQRVEELTRFFMEAKSDIEFALGGRRRRETGSPSHPDAEETTPAPAGEKGSSETGDEDDEDEESRKRKEQESEDKTDPQVEAVKLHYRLVKEKLDKRVFNPMLVYSRERDPVLYGAILCHPLVSGFDPKKEKRKKKKRKDRREKMSNFAPTGTSSGAGGPSTSSSSSSMLVPDFQAPPLDATELIINLSKFVARAIEDGSVQALLLAVKLMLTTWQETKAFKLDKPCFPLVSHLNVLHGDAPPKLPPLSEKKTSSDTAESTWNQEREGEREASFNSVNSTTSEEKQSMSFENVETDSPLSSLTARLEKFSEEDIDTSRIGEAMDEDALMARAIALSLSPEIGLQEAQASSSMEKNEDQVQSIPAKEEEKKSTCEEIKLTERSLEKIDSLPLFAFDKSGVYVDTITTIVAILSHINEICSNYLEACTNGVLPRNSAIIPHPLTFLLINSVLDVSFTNADDVSQQVETKERWDIYCCSSALYLLRMLEVYLFHSEIQGLSPASIGLGQISHGSSFGGEKKADKENPLPQKFKRLVLSCIQERGMKAQYPPVKIKESESVSSTPDYPAICELLEGRIKEQAIATWTRGIPFFYSTHSERYRLLVEYLKRGLKAFKKGESTMYLFHQIDMLCARLSLPDMSQHFVPRSHVQDVELNKLRSGSILTTEEVYSEIPDDACLFNYSKSKSASPRLWRPDAIREAITSGELSSSALEEFLQNNVPLLLEKYSSSKRQTEEILCDVYEKYFEQEELILKEVNETIKQLPTVLDLLRECIADPKWVSLSFHTETCLKHPPLIPVLERNPKKSSYCLNARVLLIRSLQDLLIDRVGGSLTDDPLPLEFDSSRCAETMSLTNGNRTAKQYTAKQWGMVMTNTGCPPNSGIHEWAVRLDRCEKGHVFLGVCTRDASVSTYVGGDRQGWGLIGTRALWHNRSKVRGDYGDGFTTGNVVHVRLNTDTGALSFGMEDHDWGIAFDGLTQHGTLYPSIGLYQRDDQVTIIPVSSQSKKSPESNSEYKKEKVVLPVYLKPCLKYCSSLIESSCAFLTAQESLLAKNDESAPACESLILNHPYLHSLLTPLLSSIALLKSYQNFSSMLAMQFIPWLVHLTKLVNRVNQLCSKVSRKFANTSGLNLNINGEWELKSMASGQIPAQQYLLSISQDEDGKVSGKSIGSFTAVTLNGTISGSKVEFLETWKQGGTCLIQGRVRIDGKTFEGTYKDTKSHTIGSIHGKRLDSDCDVESFFDVDENKLVVLEMVSAYTLGYWCNFLISSDADDALVRYSDTSNLFSNASKYEPHEDVVDEDEASIGSDLSSNSEYSEWVNTHLFAGGLQVNDIQSHIKFIIEKCNEVTHYCGCTASSSLLTKARSDWLNVALPASALNAEENAKNSSAKKFIQDLILCRGEIAELDSWISKHVGESPFLRLGGGAMKAARRVVCASMIWHGGLLSDSMGEPVVFQLCSNFFQLNDYTDSEIRPHEHLMHIWRASQRVIEWGIRSKNASGSTYSAIANEITRKAHFLLSIEPNPSMVGAASMLSIQSSGVDSGNVSMVQGLNSATERIFSESLMEVSRFIESNTKISKLKKRLLSNCTKSFLRTVGFLSLHHILREIMNDVPIISKSENTSRLSSVTLYSLIDWIHPSRKVQSNKEYLEATFGGSLSKCQSSSIHPMHYMGDIGGSGETLTQEIRTSFEHLYELLCACLSKATWSRDSDLQLVILQSWGLIIHPDDHAFLSRIGIFRVLQTVLDEARSDEMEAAPSEFNQDNLFLDRRKKVIQAALKVVHLLAAQVASSSERPESNMSEATCGNTSTFASIPLVRKPSGPETLGKSVFNMLYTELRNALDQMEVSGFDAMRNMHIEESASSNEPVEQELSKSRSKIILSDAHDYCYQICSLLYSVSDASVCRSYLCTSDWLVLLMSLINVNSLKIQHRVLKLLRKLLPSIDPANLYVQHDNGVFESVENSIEFASPSENADKKSQNALSLIYFFLDLIGCILPPSIAMHKFNLSYQSGSRKPFYKKMIDNCSSLERANSLATDAILLMRSLYDSSTWTSYINKAIENALCDIPTPSEDNLLNDNDVVMEDTDNIEFLKSWEHEYTIYKKAIASMCILDGHIQTFHVGGSVKVIAKSEYSTQDTAYRGTRGIVMSYDRDKGTAEVLFSTNESESVADAPGRQGASMIKRPVRVMVEELAPILEVNLNSSVISSTVIKSLMNRNIHFFLEELKKKMSLCMNDASLAKDQDNIETETGGSDELDDTNEDDSNSEKDSAKCENNESVHTKELKLLRVIMSLYGLRAVANMLKSEEAVNLFLNGCESSTLKELFEFSLTETKTSGLGDLMSCEESWLYLWKRWFEIQNKSISPSKSSESTECTKRDSESDEKQLNSATCQQMMEMGFPKEWCEIALARCSYNVEAAINFCFEHSNDMEKLLMQNDSSKNSLNASFNESNSMEDSETVSPLLEQLSEMGFPVTWCKKALLANRNNVDAALTWILSNGEALEAEDRREELKNKSSNREADEDKESVTVSRGANPLRTVSGQATIGEYDFLVEGLVGGGFASVGAPDCLVSSGRWYYEATLLTNGCIQIGWADSAFSGAADRGDGVGDGPHSWAYDGWRQQKWHGLSSPWGSKWKQGDVVGCGVDADAGAIIFSLNGKMKSINMGVAFRGVEFAGGLFPCASFNRREKLRFNLGNESFKYPPPPGFKPIIETLRDEVNEEKASGFDVLGLREYALEESVGEENYLSDYRYFSRDLHPSGFRSTNSHGRGGLSSTSRLDLANDLKKISDDEVYHELLQATYSLAVLQARRALIMLLAKWPTETLGPFSLSYIVNGAESNETFIKFLKLFAGFNSNCALPSNPSPNFSRSDEAFEMLDSGMSSRYTLAFLTDVTCSAIRSCITGASSTSPLNHPFVRTILDYVSSEIKLACKRDYARIAWDSSDSIISTTLLQNTSEKSEFWSDKDALKHPNIVIVMWLTKMLMKLSDSNRKIISSKDCSEIRMYLLSSWAASFRSPSICLKEKASYVISGILQDLICSWREEPDAQSNQASLLQQVLSMLPVKRLIPLCEARVSKELQYTPVCSKYLQHLLELLSSCYLASSISKSSTSDDALEGIKERYLSLKNLDAELFPIYLEEMEQAKQNQENELLDVIKSKEETEKEDNEEQSEEKQANAVSVDDNEENSAMDIDNSDTDNNPELSLATIASMVADDNSSIMEEDPDLIPDSSVLSREGSYSAKSCAENDLQEQCNTSDMLFPEEEIHFDTSLLTESEKTLLEAASYGVTGEGNKSWLDGFESGILSDTKSQLFCGTIHQFKPKSDASEIPPLKVGSKVIRGPSWKWRDQDGGVGSVGTVEGISPWSGVDGEGMSVKWPNNSSYTYRWGADGNYDLTHVEVDEEGQIIKEYPTPEATPDSDGTFGSELYLGVMLRLYESSVENDNRIHGVLELPDFGAAIKVVGAINEDDSLTIQELQMIRGNPDMGWSLRFGSENWQPGTMYTVSVYDGKEGSRLSADPGDNDGVLSGQYEHSARRNGKICKINGDITLYRNQLFHMDKKYHHPTLKISDDGLSVTCLSEESRNLALGTVGFDEGVHYWEVLVEQAEFGSVFIGVCEKISPPGCQASVSSRLNRWHGWGFVNFRATYHNSTERIYGDHFNAGDTIGVKLDMEEGKLSFFMDGIKYGEHIVADLGVAFDNVRGDRNRRILYPCIGMRKPGDRISLNGKWVSKPSISPSQTISDISDVHSCLDAWYRSSFVDGRVQVPSKLLEESWKEYCRWTEEKWSRYPIRPRGIVVDFDTSTSSCISVCNKAGLEAPIIAGDRVKICSKGGRELDQPEEAVVLGVYRGHLWYRTETQGNEGADEGRLWAWYWNSSELLELIVVKRFGKDMTSADAELTNVESSEKHSRRSFLLESASNTDAINSFETFKSLALSDHSVASDFQLIERMNSFCSTIGVDINNLKFSDLMIPDEIASYKGKLEQAEGAEASDVTVQSFVKEDYFSSPSLKEFSGAQIRARFVLLKVLNNKLLRVMPYLKINSSENSSNLVRIESSKQKANCNDEWTYQSISKKLRCLRRLIFTSTKRRFWDSILKATTTSTPLPSDEYEDPREIRIIRINRIQAQPAKLALLPQPSDRLRKSVFGQLYREMRTWNDSFFRRAYCGKGHGGQRRAFKVKFLGEGVNDYGGPYRAVFEQIVDELQMDNVELSKGEQGLLPLLLPTPNRRSGTGVNQDKFVLNPSCGSLNTSNGPTALDLHRFLGKITGTAVRHGLQMGLDFPSLVWRPLAGLEVGFPHLKGIDVVTANSLENIRSLSSESDEIAEILDQLNFTTYLSDGSLVPLIPNGDKVNVDFTNRLQYCDLVEKKRLSESQLQLSAFEEGLASVLPMELAQLFTPKELEELICGQREVDVELLKQCTEYEEVDENTPHIQYFWQVLEEMSNEERTSFLRFVWARSRMPSSIKDFPMNFKIQAAHDQGARKNPDLYLPHAQTCFFSLSLPSYSSKQVLREKLLYAIQNSPNMDADVRLHNAEGWADA